MKRKETAPHRNKERDHTFYWTLSFYLPPQVVGTRFVKKKVDNNTKQLRDGIEPLFNDIADRSRPGLLDSKTHGRTVFDRLFAADPTPTSPSDKPRPPEQLIFRIPKHIFWTTEGNTYAVEVQPHLRERSVNLRRFWYQYSNGALSWHLSFEYCYADDLLKDADGPPISFYFLSLLQKLSSPKECRCDGSQKTVDDLIGIDVKLEDGNHFIGFWSQVEQWFDMDGKHIVSKRKRPSHAPLTTARQILAQHPLLDLPDITHFDNRSLFFIHDKALFNLIQPVEDGALIKRRKRILDAEFSQYPVMIEEVADRTTESSVITLDGDYWQQVRNHDREGKFRDTQVNYLFLAGFNQNIIDFMNQEASEVLDSLDPIYPTSDEQEEEGFFVRYANPHALVTYVPRSRTLEVGKNYIGTCPYAFLIHTLAMHNEALTRLQEMETYKNISKIQEKIREGDENVSEAILLMKRKTPSQADNNSDDDKNKNEKKIENYIEYTSNKALANYEEAENLIDNLRVDAFELYDRHRYANPFRYDTERDVFDALERLRGTSRLRASHETAIAALEQRARDLARKQALFVEHLAQESEKKSQEAAQNEREKHESRFRKVSYFFGILSISGVVQAIFAALDYFERK